MPDTLPANELPPTEAFAPLTTARLTLRPFRAADAAALHRLVNDWEVCRMLASVPYPYARDEADRFIATATEGIAAGTAYHLAVVGAEAGEDMLVGGVSLHVDAAARDGRLGYWVGRRFWGHGVATEAAGRMVRWAMANLDVDRLRANAASENAASQVVLRRIGFAKTGTGHEHFVGRGGMAPITMFEATRETLTDGVPAPAAAPGAAVAKPMVLVAACALVDVDGRVLLARRPEGKKMAGLWEFPGGKLEPGETPEAALIRELHEELGIDVARACLAPFAFASHAYPKFHLLMPLFLCRRWNGKPVAREGQTLAWVRPEKLATYPMPAADKPLVPLLRDFL